LRSIQNQPDAVRSALDAAFLSNLPEVRISVVRVYKEAKTALSDFPERALADIHPDVREAAVELLPLLPENDSRRITLLQNALSDKNEAVRRQALRAAANLGAESATPLADYAARGLPLTDEFFTALREVRPLSEALITALKARVQKAPARLRRQIEESLQAAGVSMPAFLQSLYRELASADDNKRLTAATKLFSLKEDIWADHGRIAAVLMSARVHEIIEERLDAALHLLYPPEILPLDKPEKRLDATIAKPPGSKTKKRVDATIAKRVDGKTAKLSDELIRAGAKASPMSHLAAFPWPPPAGFTRVAVPRELLAPPPQATLGDVYQTLIRALESASDGFEHGLFEGVPGGFALVARMETYPTGWHPASGSGALAKGRISGLQLDRFPR
jgi:hypothetical protein